MAEFRSPVPHSLVERPGVRIEDESSIGKWRIWDELWPVPVGKAELRDGRLVLAVAPGEWIVVGERPPGVDTVDLTHVRAGIRVTGTAARVLLERVCALDLADDMTPDGAAARTLVAGVATEVARDDRAGAPSYLLLMSRSFAGSVHERLVAAAG